jgi:peroxiredoxin
MNKKFPNQILKAAFLLTAVFLLCSCFARRGNTQEASGMTAAFAAARIPLLAQTVSARDFSLPLLLPAGKTGEETLTLSDLRGKVVFLNFWATWCPPCRDEMPSMESLYNRFRDREFEMLAVNCMEEAAIVRNFKEEYNLTFPILLDSDGRVSNAYGIRAIPMTFLINKDGRIVVRFVGSIDWDTPEIHKALEMLLNS